MKKKDCLEYSQAIKNILKNSLYLYHRGESVFYRVMAVQLRILLNDTTRRHGRTRDISLLPLVSPDLELPVPAGLSPISDKLPLKDWLNLQIKIDEDSLTIRQLIRRVCHRKSGAHVNPKVNAGIPHSKETQKWIVQLSELVLKSME